MRFAIFFLALLITIPAEAGKKNPKREPANRFPGRVFAFVCRDEGGEEDNVIGLTRSTLTLKDHNTGSTESQLYIRTKNGYQFKQTNGRLTMSPSEVVIVASDGAFFGGQAVTIRLNSAEKTNFPDHPNQVCVVTAQMYQP